MSWVEAWAGTALFFGICLIWGPQDAEVGAIAAVGGLALLTYDLGWIVPINMAAFGIAISCLGTLAMIYYLKKRAVRAS